MSKILYVATVVKTHIMEFHLPYLKMLKEMGWETAVAARNDYENPLDCTIPFCDTYYDVPFERNPFKLDNIKAYTQLKKIIDDGHYDIIHCHTPVGGVLTRLAAEDARRNGCKVFYTAHGFHFFNGAPLINWLLYYPIEKHLAKKTDVLITINHEDYNRAKKFKAGSVVNVPGVGIDINKFKAPDISREQMRRCLGLTIDDVVLITVAELTKNKNQFVVLSALKKIKKDKFEIYNNLHYLIVGCGTELDFLKKKATQFNIESHVHFLGYCKDINNLNYASDICVFPSIREGLGLGALESMLCGLPIVCSNNRGTREYAIHGENAFCCKSNNAEEFAHAIESLFCNLEKRREMGNKAREKAMKFNLDDGIKILIQLYSECKAEYI